MQLTYRIPIISIYLHARIQRGGAEGPDPTPGKSQVIWVSIGNKQLDLHPPPPAVEKVGPPPPPPPPL